MADDPKPGDDTLDEEIPEETPDPPEEIDEPGDAETDPADADPDDPDLDTDPADGGGDDKPEPRERTSGRRNETIRSLRERARTAERDRDAEIARRTGNQPDQAAAGRAYQEEEQRKLAAAQELERLGEPGATSRYWNERTVREARGVSQFATNQSFERDDSREFRSLTREIPAYNAVKDWVEDYVGKQRAQGNFALTREAAATYRIGQLAIERAHGKGGEQHRQRAERTRDRQRVPAPRGGSDQPAARTRKVKSSDDLDVDDFERQYGNQPIR
jgi:hypothetical protein